MSKVRTQNATKNSSRQPNPASKNRAQKEKANLISQTGLY